MKKLKWAECGNPIPTFGMFWATVGLVVYWVVVYPAVCFWFGLKAACEIWGNEL